MKSIRITAVKQLIHVLLFISDNTEAVAYTIAKRYARLLYPPSSVQYLNRLVEFYDGPDIWAAAYQYAKMLDAGIDPEHAFQMMTEQFYGS